MIHGPRKIYFNTMFNACFAKKEILILIHICCYFHEIKLFIKKSVNSEKILIFYIFFNEMIIARRIEMKMLWCQLGHIIKILILECCVSKSFN